MLTLTRKAGQKIRIGDRIEIVVREIRGKQVRLGIVAPEGMAVYREELYQQIAQENERAAQVMSLDHLSQTSPESKPVVLEPLRSRKTQS